MSFRSKTLFLAFLILLCAGLNAQTITEAQFIDKPIRDILIVLGQLGGKSIVVDETVTGNATHYIKDKPFDQALGLVLQSNHLYAKDDNGVLIVSRIDASADEKGLITVSAEGVQVDSLLRRIARAAKRTILYDPLPPIFIDVQLDKVSLASALGTIVKRLPGFSLETADTAFYVKALPVASGGANVAGPNALQIVKRPNGNFDIKGKSVRFSDVIEQLFSNARMEYSMLKRSDIVIDRLNFEDKAFDQVLRLVLELSDGDFTVKDGIYYIFDVNRNEVLKKFEASMNIQLRNLSVNQILNLLPSNLLGGNAVKIDRSSNSMIVSGSSEEIDPIVAFIKTIDRPPQGLDYYRFDVMYVPVQSLISLLPEQLKVVDPLVLQAQNALLLLLSPERYELARAFMAAVDRPRPPQVIQLKYIKADDLMAKLPTFLTREMVSVGPDQRYVFFSGSPEQFALVQDQMRFIDIPVPQIKYQVLIVQYQTSKDLTLTPPQITVGTPDSSNKVLNSLTGDKMPLDGGNLLSLVGNVGNSLNFTANLISSFGINFAATLEAKMSDNTAMILADTTLNALSNQDVSFRNTTTERFRTEETNSNNGNSTTTGVVREVVSGLVVTLKGWASGDGMVTLTISTTFSKAGAADLEKGVLPSTFEKIFTTSVRSPSGVPVVLGGLVEARSDHTVTATPGVSEIPVLGELFKSNVDNQSRTELMIYVIPRIENQMLLNAPVSDALAYLYRERFASED